MHVRFWRRWLAAGVLVVAVAMAAGLTLGLLQEALVLLFTLVACALSLLPMFVDRPARPHRRAAVGRAGWRGRQEA